MENAEFWAKHLRQREERGITRKAYCRETGLSLWRWYYWQRKLTPKELVPVSSGVSGRFVRVHLARDPVSMSGCEFVYPSGVRIRMRELPPASWVRQVV
jgi:hypothetical protein